MKLLLMVSALNGLSQRAWCALERAGHDVVVRVVEREDDMRDAASTHGPDLIVCPFLTTKVPAEVWQCHRTIIIHPGPVGDRGPSSLDWAIADAERQWGVTALQAVEEMDAGPIWATRTFPLCDPAGLPARKSAVYNGPVADAAMACIEEVVEKAADPNFVPTPLALADRTVTTARLRPAMTQDDRWFSWEASTEHIVRRIRAADGAPGVRTELAGRSVYAYDVQPALPQELDAHTAALPGDIICHTTDAVHVRTGDGSVWLGHLRAVSDVIGDPTIKLPATTVLRDRLPSRPCPQESHASFGDDLRYWADGETGWLTFDFYNGAMSTRHCERLLAALRHATEQDTRALVLRGSTEAFSNGIHLNAIEGAPDPPGEAWANIKAMNAVCARIISESSMTVLTAFSGNAGAGGVMLGLGGGVVVAREGVVLNPYYDIGLYGSELHTHVLPQRVGPEIARRLLDERRPVDADQALALGLVDAVGPRDPAEFDAWLGDIARFHARSGSVPTGYRGRIPLDAVEARELAEMSHDMFDDRAGFAAARGAFVYKTPKERVTAAV